MKKIKLLLFLFCLALLPVIASAKEYVDKAYDIVGEKQVDTVTIYFFHQSTCAHCRAENVFLDDLEKKYGSDLRIKRYEILSSQKNRDYMNAVKERLGLNRNAVPLTIIGETSYFGFSDSISVEIENTVNDYINSLSGEGTGTSTKKKIPLLGEIDVKKVSIPLVAVILGFIDGFNPCALWVLLFLINMLLNMQDKKKMWLIGFTFLLTSAFVYFLAMLGISVALSFTAVIYVRILIALVAIIGGSINLKNYFKMPKDGCTVVDEKKRKKYFTQIKKFTSEKNIFLALIGVIILALSVNIVELACSAGFPAIFISILDLNNISLLGRVLYILLYVLFYLLDDLIIFVIAMLTLKVSGITTKYNKVSHLVGGIIMILIGLLLIFKPEWIMFNF